MMVRLFLFFLTGTIPAQVPRSTDEGQSILHVEYTQIDYCKWLSTSTSDVSSVIRLSFHVYVYPAISPSLDDEKQARVSKRVSR